MRVNTTLSNMTGQTVTDTSKFIIQGWCTPYTTGCLINIDNVYSICSGTVIDIGKDDKNDLYSVTVEYNYQTWVRYCLLKSYNVKLGEKIVTTNKIGNAYKNKLRFEYCTVEQSNFPIRVSTRQLYKHDPTPVIFGNAVSSEVT